MSRTVNPSGWQPSCWVVFVVAVAAVTAVTVRYTVGAP